VLANVVQEVFHDLYWHRLSSEQRGSLDYLGVAGLTWIVFAVVFVVLTVF
jgi:hypothetical protein